MYVINVNIEAIQARSWASAWLKPRHGLSLSRQTATSVGRDQTEARRLRLRHLAFGTRSFFPRDGMVKVGPAKDDEASVRSRRILFAKLTQMFFRLAPNR